MEAAYYEKCFTAWWLTLSSLQSLLNLNVKSMALTWHVHSDDGSVKKVVGGIVAHITTPSPPHLGATCTSSLIIQQLLGVLYEVQEGEHRSLMEDFV